MNCIIADVNICMRPCVLLGLAADLEHPCLSLIRTLEARVCTAISSSLLGTGGFCPNTAL